VFIETLSELYPCGQYDDSTKAAVVTFGLARVHATQDPKTDCSGAGRKPTTKA